MAGYKTLHRTLKSRGIEPGSYVEGKDVVINRGTRVEFVMEEHSELKAGKGIRVLCVCRQCSRSAG